MRSRPSLRSHLQLAILKRSVIAITGVILVSLTATFFLSRYKLSTDLEKSAASISKAFRSRILEGDVKSVQRQISDLLNMDSAGERALLLSSEFQPIYQAAYHGGEPVTGTACKTVGQPCFDGYFGPGEILYPIYFDEANENLFGYLLLSRQLHFDWLYTAIVFMIFAGGYAVLLLGVGRVTKRSLKEMSDDINSWSVRLKRNPKDDNPLSEAPFSELQPLKEAIEGLNSQIEDFETKAGERAKMLLLRGIAHDILGPISQAQMYLATLQMKFSHESVAEDLLSEMKASLRKVSLLASQVKCLNDVAEPVEPIDFVKAAEREIGLLRDEDKVRSKAIRLQLSHAGRGPILAPMTRVEFSRVLQNLIHNAADASPPGSLIHVEIAEDYGASTIAVSDSGLGIPADIQAKVFEPDYTSKGPSGTGLGLFVVKHICELREGTVNIKSNPGKGTTMTVRIPSTTLREETHAV